MTVAFGLLPLPDESTPDASRRRWGLREMAAHYAEFDEIEAIDSVWMGEGPPVGSMKGRSPGPEIMVRLAAVAAITRRVRLGVACMASFPTRDPLYVAAQWASLDHLAGPGRMVLIVCQGQPRRYEGEERAWHIPWGKERVARMEECMAVVRACWTQERLTYHGTYFDFDDLAYGPKPLTQPHPPMYIAGNPPPAEEGAPVSGMVRRLARYADGWQTTHVPVDIFERRWREVQLALAAEGRDPSTFVANVYYNVCIADDASGAFTEAKGWLERFYGREMPREEVDSWTAYGTPRDVVAKLKAYADAGATEFVIRITAHDQAAQTKRLIREVIPEFRTAAATRR